MMMSGSRKPLTTPNEQTAQAGQQQETAARLGHGIDLEAEIVEEVLAGIARRVACHGKFVELPAEVGQVLHRGPEGRAGGSERRPGVGGEVEVLELERVVREIHVDAKAVVGQAVGGD